MAETSILSVPNHLIQTDFIGSESIEQLNREGFRFKNETVKLIDDCRDAMAVLPAGIRGLVVGSGQNTSEWHRKSWETVDIWPLLDPSCPESEQPTFVADVNYLSEVEGIKPGVYDYFLSEKLTLSPVAGTLVECSSTKGNQYNEPAVGHENLLIQAAHVLKMGGKLIIKTADFGNDESSNLPKSEEYALMMRKYGFAPVLEIHQIDDFTDPEKRVHGVQVTWYAEKVSDYKTQDSAGK